MGKATADTTRVLLIEGEQDVAQKMMSLLVEADPQRYRIARAHNLKQAIEILSQENFAIILLNLTLPDSDGLSTLSKLRIQAGGTPLIIINGPDDEIFAHKTLNEGATDYLSRSEVDSANFPRALRFAKERSKGLKHQGPSSEDFKITKLAAISRMTEDVAHEMRNPIESIHGHIGVLKQEFVDKKIFGDKVKVIFNSAENSVKDLKNIASDLQEFSKELSDQVGSAISPPIRILVVEDEPQVCDVILNRLQRLKQNLVDTAKNGQEAYNKCLSSFKEGKPYALIISDWKMPKMSGLELLEKLRKNIYFKDVPFMMISAVDERAAIQEVVRMKVSQYLLKPFTKEEFDKRFKRLLYHTD